jgi:hypothetical protein
MEATDRHLDSPAAKLFCDIERAFPPERINLVRPSNRKTNLDNN